MNIKELLKDVGKNHNSLLVALFYRRLSIPVANVLYKYTPLTPNQVTILSGVAGFFAMLLVYFVPTYQNFIIAAILFQAEVVLDCVDGNLARLKNMKSKFGSWLDTNIGILTQIFAYFTLAFAAVSYVSIELSFIMVAIALASRLTLNVSAAEAEFLFSTRDTVKIDVRNKIAKKLGVNPVDVTFSDDLKFLIASMGLLFNKPFEALVFLTGLQLILLLVFWAATFKSHGKQ